MLKVLPIQTKDHQKECAEKCDVPYIPDALAYEATVDGELVGICQFRVTAEGGLIYDLASVPGIDDFESMFIMGRGTLNFIDLCGVHRAFYRGDLHDESLIRAIGFKKNDDGIYEIDLEGFFTEPCKRHREEK